MVPSESIAAGQDREAGSSRHCAGNEKPGAPPRGAGLSRQSYTEDLDGPHGLGLRAAVALRDVELHPLALFEGAVAIRLDS